jgi:hypothetical protein
MLPVIAQVDLKKDNCCIVNCEVEFSVGQNAYVSFNNWNSHDPDTLSELPHEHYVDSDIYGSHYCLGVVSSLTSKSSSGNENRIASLFFPCMNQYIDVGVEHLKVL